MSGQKQDHKTNQTKPKRPIKTNPDLNFQNWKKNAMTKMSASLDRSRAGGVDPPIQTLVENINKNKNTYTTSSCSGRIIIFSDEDSSAPGKGHCTWHLTSHGMVSYRELLEAVSLKCLENTSFSIKFEPCILHVMCKDVDTGRTLVETARSAGFRNSGITMGMPSKNSNINKPMKINVAIRHTLGMEVPFSDSKFLLNEFDNRYLKYLHETLNSKMVENFKNIEKLTERVLSCSY